MAGILTVQTIQGPTSGANANKVIIPAGQTLDASAGGMTLPAGVGGKVLQVISATTQSTTSTTSTSYTDTAISASITPSATSSKIMIIVSIPVQSKSGSSVGADNHKIGLFRGASELATTVSGTREANGFFDYVQSGSHINFLDSPSSTSSLTYSIKIKTNHTDTSIFAPYGGGHGTITLMEIAG